MKKLIAGTFAAAMLLFMGAMTADAGHVWVEHSYPGYSRTVSYTSYSPYYDTWNYYDSTYTSSYTVETVSGFDTYYVAPTRYVRTFRCF